MRLLIVCAYPYPASNDEPLFCGGQYFPLYLSRALVRAGAEVHVVSRKTQDQPSEQRIHGVHVHRYFSMTHIGGHRRGISLSLRRYALVENLLKTRAFDWAISLSPLVWELPLINRRNVSYGYLVPGLNVGYLKNLNTGVRNFLRKCFIQLVSRPLLQWNLRNARLVAPNCLNDARMTEAFFHLDSQPAVFPNGVDTSLYRPVERIEEVPEFLTVGRFSPEKGFHLVVSAARILAEKKFPFRLSLVGFVDNSSYLARIRRMVLDLGLSEFVRITNNVPEAQMPALFAGARAFIAFSTGYDPLPSALLQAMSCGTPVITTDWPARGEVVRPGENGWPVPEGNVRALASAMESVLEDPHMAERMGRAARAYILAERDMNQIASGLFARLSQILRRGYAPSVLQARKAGHQELRSAEEGSGHARHGRADSMMGMKQPSSEPCMNGSPLSI